MTQLHAGHYGSQGNFRFHAILSDGAWNSSYLLPLKEYLDKRTVGIDNINTQAIVDQFLEDLKKKDPSEMKKITREQKLITTTYIKHLRRLFPVNSFLSLIEDTEDQKQDKRKESCIMRKDP